MKKIFLSLLIIVGATLILNATPVSAQTKPVSSTVKPKVVAKPATTAKTVVKPKVVAKPKAVAVTSKFKTTMDWDASGLKYLSTPSHFDYSSTIRNAVIKKIENYARRNKIKVISLAVINSMRE